MTNNILIVDDSQTVCNTLKSILEKNLDYNIIIAHSKQECANKLLEYKGKISFAILDLGLPDALNGEVVPFVTKFKIPSIILTGSKRNVYEYFKNEYVIDYVIKESGYYSYEYTVNLVNTIINNKSKKVLVVDDSKTMSSIISNLLKRYHLNIYKAYDGLQALEILEKNKDISLIFTDYSMPNMDGLSLTKEIRKKYSKDEKAIVTITDNQDTDLVSKFLKSGANDFLYKGFSTEEFYARLNSNLQTLDLFTEIKDKANKDFLTGAYNRRFFFDDGRKRFEVEDNIKLFMIDIDKFKNINDTYGHNVGDIAIKEVITILKKQLKDVDCIISRFGGEEFCIMVFNISNIDFLSNLEDIRYAFEYNVIETKYAKISYTVSIGYAIEKLQTVDQMITHCDEGLYKAKNSGRNQVRT